MDRFGNKLNDIALKLEPDRSPASRALVPERRLPVRLPDAVSGSIQTIPDSVQSLANLIYEVIPDGGRGRRPTPVAAGMHADDYDRVSAKLSRAARQAGDAGSLRRPL